MPVKEYLFSNTLNPLDLDSMFNTAVKALRDVKELTLYVTGLTVALVEVIKAYAALNISLTLYHYDRDSGTYYPQKV
jgi:hypothetical protein